MARSIPLKYHVIQLANHGTRKLSAGTKKIGRSDKGNIHLVKMVPRSDQQQGLQNIGDDIHKLQDLEDKYKLLKNTSTICCSLIAVFLMSGVI